jgi:MFS family permease
MVRQSKYLSNAQIFLITAPAFILYGYNQAGLSALLTLPDVVRLFPEIDTIHTSGVDKAHRSTLQGLVNGCLQLGALPGALSCSVIGDRLGRRKTIFLGGLLAGIGQILQCTAFYLPQFIIGRCSRSWSWASDCHCAGMAV